MLFHLFTALSARPRSRPMPRLLSLPPKPPAPGSTALQDVDAGPHAWPADPDEVPGWVLAREARMRESGFRHVRLPARTRAEFDLAVARCRALLEPPKTAEPAATAPPAQPAAHGTPNSRYVTLRRDLLVLLAGAPEQKLTGLAALEARWKLSASRVSRILSQAESEDCIAREQSRNVVTIRLTAKGRRAVASFAKAANKKSRIAAPPAPAGKPAGAPLLRRVA